jgi:hypothetical protein
MKPPKCRTCGKEEWHHVCGPKREAGKAKANSKKRLRRGYHRKYWRENRSVEAKVGTPKTSLGMKHES